LARSNYRFHKREKELARKNKQEQKRKNKTEKKDTLPETYATPGPAEEENE
jgi:hypothetical protein